MIKFEEHEGRLFLMLEKPVPLTIDAEMPCLVRLIQDDSPMGKYNRNMRKSPLDIIEMCVGINRQYQYIISNSALHYARYEVIGYPVSDGSNEWALYQMMQGKKVCNPQLAKDKATRLGCCDDEIFNTYWYIVGDTVVEGKSDYGALSVSSWLFAASSTGWQIYEPKPEPQPAKEPIANCENCKHVCTNSNIDYCHMYEPKPTFKVGDWVKYSDLNLFLQVVEPSGKNRTTCRTLSGAIIYPCTSHLTKASPSDAVIQIGCLSGTIRYCLSFDNDGAKHDAIKMFNSNGKSIAAIRLEALDKETRELVEGLLKEQN